MISNVVLEIFLTNKCLIFFIHDFPHYIVSGGRVFFVTIPDLHCASSAIYNLI
jgi:hypothetical protein